MSGNYDEDNDNGDDEDDDDLAKDTKSWQFLPAASNRPLAAQPWRQKLINLQNVKLQIFCLECCHGMTMSWCGFTRYNAPLVTLEVFKLILAPS